MPSTFAQFRSALEDSGETIYEELANTLTHSVAAILAAAALPFLLTLAAFTGSGLAIAACAVYGTTLFATFLCSSVYHGSRNRKIKALFLTLDQCSIFLLIAGTYTPFVLLAYPQPLGWALFATNWTLALAGIGLRLMIGYLHWSLIPVFLGMGWLAFPWADVLFAAIGEIGGWLMVGGGIAYTVGVVFFLWNRLPFNHAVWHVCVIIGAVCHFIAVALYALPW